MTFSSECLFAICISGPGVLSVNLTVFQFYAILCLIQGCGTPALAASERHSFPGAAPRFRGWGTKSVASEASEKISGLSPQEQQFGGGQNLVFSDADTNES
jgi:hypothetical protein